MPKMPVSGLMTRPVFALRRDDDLATLRDLMEDRDVRHVPVVDPEGDLLGLVTHRDLLRTSLVEQEDTPDFVEHEVLSHLTVGDIMTSDVETVTPEADIREAAQLMYENKFGCLPVVEGSHLVGILTESDFVRLMAQGH